MVLTFIFLMKIASYKKQDNQHDASMHIQSICKCLKHNRNTFYFFCLLIFDCCIIEITFRLDDILFFHHIQEIAIDIQFNQ